MSKKYKLIKKYPGSPELGTIAYKNGDYSMSSIIFEEPRKKYTTYESSTENVYFEEMISSQPEFWEEIVENGYEILSYTSEESGLIINKNFEGFCISEYKIKNASIHSVKRLSDGEIFTVGDKVRLNQAGTQVRTIKSIHKTKTDDIIFEHASGAFFIKNAIKSKFLFRTEDGVDIYEGDYVCWIARSKYGSGEIYDYRTADDSMITDGSILYFSTKEAAEEYILMNKPCLSINDVLNSLSYDNSSIKNSIKLTKDQLEILVKSRY